MDSSKPDLIVGNTRPKNSSHSNWHGCYCAYSFVIVMEDKMQKKPKNIYEKKVNRVIKDDKKRRTPNVWLYFNMIIQG